MAPTILWPNHTLACEAHLPLALDLKHGDKIIVNGAVIENSGHNTQILIHNDAAVLRGKEIMIEDTANTPASRAYFALQCAYVFPSSRDQYLRAFDRLLADYLDAAPSSAPVGKEILDKLQGGSLYGALKAARKLVAHERKVMERLGLEVTDHGFEEVAPPPPTPAAAQPGRR